MPVLTVTTGDVSASPPARRILCMNADAGKHTVALELDGATARVDYTSWPHLLNQVEQRSLTEWKYGNDVLPPMSNPDMRLLLAKITSTPTYQLFLAAFQIAQRVQLLFAPPDALQNFCSDTLSERMLRSSNGGGLYFPPIAYLTEVQSQQPNVLNELLDKNKLCYLTVEDFHSWYVPYATPISTPREFSPAAYRVWKKIRDFRERAGRGA